MRHATKEAVSTTRSLVPRMFRILGITMLLCLALGLSFSVPASAHQARPTIAASCTANQTWLLDSPAGSVTVWSDQSAFPGPGTSNQEAKATVTLDATTSPNTICGFSLQSSFTVTDPHTHNTVTISKVTPCSPAGTFDPTTGALTLNGTLTLNNVPFFQGAQTTKCSTLSTENTINPPDHSTHSGSRVNSSGNVTLEGQTSFTNLITVNIWSQFAGTFKRQS
ncbi:MAG TPA: hypothetical protein VFB60_15140 [Ktedonobacteraceae bacterium]|nr:hypothetical protein [Ktedonobacteraceae bacterium]